MKNTRTFIAIPIDRSQSRLTMDLVDQLSELGYGYKWSSEENLHVTLNFLGDVPETELNSVCKTVKSCVEAFDSFEMSIGGIGAFPSLEKPRIVWAGIQSGSEAMCEIQESIAAGLQSIGYPREARPFRPHLTLGRIRRNSRPDSKLGEELVLLDGFDAGSTQVHQVIVYSSFLDRSGPVYTPISRIDL